MVGHHVFQRARPFVKASATFESDGFGCGYLHVIDIGAIPEGLKHCVGEASDGYVLNRTLACEVINSIDLAFLDFTEQLTVECLCRFQIVAERLFHDHAAPVLSFLADQLQARELLDDWTNERRCCRQVEKPVPTCTPLRFYLLETALQGLEGVSIFEVTFQVRGTIPQPLHRSVRCILSPELVEAIGNVLTKTCIVPLLICKTKKGECIGQSMFDGQVKQGWKKQTLEQIATCTEDNHGTRRCCLLFLLAHGTPNFCRT